jgi:predicted metal-dependent peptidase
VIIEDSIKDKEAFELFRRGLQDLMLFFPLCGLSYLGEAVEVREDTSIETLCTDGRGIYYSPKWIKNIEHKGRVFDSLHEWLHIFFNHVARCGDRDRHVWNIAADIVVVREACRILSRDGGEVWEAPTDGVIPPDWAEDMTAEQIYDELISRHQAMPKRGPGQGEHEKSEDFLYEKHPHSLSVGAEEEFRRKFTEELAQAVLIQQQINNKTTAELFGPTIATRLEEVLNGKVPWSRLLRGQMIDDMGHRVPSYAPPNKRYFDEITLPSMRSTKEERLVLLIDVSASVGPTLMSVFKSNVMPAAMRAKETIVVTFDAVVREVVRTKHPKKVLDQVKFLTGAHSHTSTVGAFEIVDKFRPKALACLTDGHIELPDKVYPQMNWVIPQNGRPLPWGRNFVMDVSW